MPHARTTDPKTSHDAAKSVSNINKTQQAILEMLEWGTKTDGDIIRAIYQRYGQIASESGIRSRRSELVALGKVIDSGDRVKLPSGRNAIVWQAA